MIRSTTKSILGSPPDQTGGVRLMGVPGPNRAAACPANVGTLEFFASSSLRGKLGGLDACGATFRYMVPPPNISLTRLFSKPRLKRKDFREIARLSWAQEAPGSNPGAPTNLCFLFPIT